MRVRNFSFCLAFLLAQLGVASKDAPQNCQLSLPASVKGDETGLRIVSHFLDFEMRATTGTIGRLHVQNRGSKGIARLFIVMSYYDPKGRFLFAIPYEANWEGYAKLPMELNAFVENLWDQVLDPGELAILTGTNLATGTKAPARAEISSLSVVFADGTGAGREKGVPAVMPFPIWFPENIALGSLAKDTPDEVWAVLKLDSRGRVTDSTFGGGNPIPVELSDQLKNYLRAWRFVPATELGFAVEAELNVLVRFRKAYMPPTRSCPLDSRGPDAFVVLDLVEHSPSQWNSYYAGHPAAGEFRAVVASGGLAGKWEERR